MIGTIPARLPGSAMGHNLGMVNASKLKADGAVMDAVEFARAAAVDEAGAANVGVHVAAAMEDERVATHFFECTNPGYGGWRWAVTVVRAPRSKVVTINEVVLLPGDEAIVAPAWVPWSERLRAGDLGVGDVLPPAPDDVRLIPGYAEWEDLQGAGEATPMGWEIGIGRLQVLSVTGRDEAADRWQHGDFGPDSEMARSVDMQCSTCGFLLPVSGSLGQAFGVCANMIAPADGHVVALDYGCGAHSLIQADDVPVRQSMASDELGWDSLELGHS
jgi:hypothetical protein